MEEVVAVDKTDAEVDAFDEVGYARNSVIKEEKQEIEGKWAGSRPGLNRCVHCKAKTTDQ
jgi:hypothetical protein